MLGDDWGENKAPPTGAREAVDGQLALEPCLHAHTLVHWRLDGIGDVAGKHLAQLFANAAKDIQLERLGKGIVGRDQHKVIILVEAEHRHGSADGVER